MLKDLFPGLVDMSFLNNSAFAWIMALGIAFIVYLAAFGILRFIGVRFKLRAQKGWLPISAVLGEVFGATRGSLIFILSVAVGLRSLTFPEGTAKILGIVAFAAAGIQVALWLSALVVSAIQQTYSKGDKPRANAVIIDLLSRAAQIVVWSIILIVVLDNAGVDVTTFIASIGIGGVAIAFALQKVLGDLFASIAIGLDKPFEVGDFISFNGNSGTVERVGIRTTQITAISGERLVVTNSILTDTVLSNISIMEERRVSFKIRVAYGTTRAEAKKIVDGVSALIDGNDQARLHAAHLSSFEKSGLEFGFTYYVIVPDFGVYLDVQQDINFGIMELLESMDVGFAVPTRTVRVSEGESLTA